MRSLLAILVLFFSFNSMAGIEPDRMYESVKYRFPDVQGVEIFVSTTTTVKCSNLPSLGGNYTESASLFGDLIVANFMVLQGLCPEDPLLAPGEEIVLSSYVLRVPKTTDSGAFGRVIFPAGYSVSVKPY